MKLLISHGRTTLLLALAIFLVSVMGIFLSQRLETVQRSSIEISHYERVRLQTAETLQSISDVGGGITAFQLTHDEGVFAAADRANSILPTQLSALRDLTRHDTNELGLVDRLAQVALHRRAQAAEIRRLAHNGDVGGVKKSIASGEGRDLVNQSRLIVDELREVAQRSLEVQRRSADHAYQTAMIMIGVSVAGAIALLLALTLVTLRDTQKITAAQERSRLSEAQLQRAQDAGGVGLFNLNLATRLLNGTPEFYRIYGMRPRDSVSLAELDALAIPDITTELVISGGSWVNDPLREVEFRIRRADTGVERWVARTAKYEGESNGKPANLVGFIHDVTRRRGLEREAQANAAQFLTFAQTLPNHVWTAPPDGQLDWFNDRVYEYSGMLRGSLNGTGWVDMVYDEDRPVAAERWAAALSSEDGYEMEFRLRRADGHYRWHLARALPIRDSTGAVIRWVGTNTDIHEHKLAQLQSTQERDRIWTLSQEIMLVCDLQGLILAVNPSTARLLEISENDIVGHPMSEFVHPDDHESTLNEIGQLSRGAKSIAFENRYRTSDGSYRLLAWTAVRDSGFIHALARDVTREREAEEKLRQSQKMEAVGQLTGGIAHDFNNLLQGILGSLDLLKMRALQGRVSELDRYINSAMTSAHRASALTHRLLAFSRRQPLDPKPLWANPLITSMEDMLRRTLGERIRLELVMAGGLWPTKCDANQLESAILNLVINARDAMPNGGSLVIETGNTHLDAAYVSREQDLKAGQYVCIGVSDTGTGMSADTIRKAFEPFFTTKPLGHGTGLGLSMIYGFARQSEGYVKIYSELEKGTTVKLYLPRHWGEKTDDDDAAPIIKAPLTEAHETVLVVEDEPVVRGLILEVLRDLGYRALEADDGPSGLAILQSPERIDLMISDIGLPILNGRQIADAGRQVRPNLKVLYMTGYAENAVIASGFLETGMSMMTKPFAIEVLVSKVREMLEDDVV